MVTKIFVWVILVVTLLMAFNGYVTTQQFNEFQKISLAQLAAFETYHADEIKSHDRLDYELNELTEQIEALHKCLEKNKKKVATATE